MIHNQVNIHVARSACARLIGDVTGAAVSAGFVHSCLARAAEMAADVVKLIKMLIRFAPWRSPRKVSVRAIAAASPRIPFKTVRLARYVTTGIKRYPIRSMGLGPASAYSPMPGQPEK